ncbi:hypothetical protein ABIF78_007781 [Bradyrhizobium japonicum]
MDGRRMRWPSGATGRVVPPGASSAVVEMGRNHDELNRDFCHRQEIRIGLGCPISGLPDATGERVRARSPAPKYTMSKKF